MYEREGAERRSEHARPRGRNGGWTMEDERDQWSRDQRPGPWGDGSPYDDRYLDDRPEAGGRYRQGDSYPREQYGSEGGSSFGGYGYPGSVERTGEDTRAREGGAGRQYWRSASHDEWPGERRSRETYGTGTGGYGGPATGLYRGSAIGAYGYSTGQQVGAGRYSGRGPKGYTRTRERILDDVCERLTDHPELDASGIEVDVEKDVVVLRGTVEDRGQKRMAEDVAESVSGVRDIRNELGVEKGMLQSLTDAITGRSEETLDTAAAPRKARDKHSV
jgi:osmotically-inducible protein OsmY